MSSDQTGKPDPLNITLVAGDVAPRYDEEPTLSLDLERCVITEQGMSSGLPMVDLVFRAPSGHRLVFVTSGRIMLALAAALRGVNMRNHGNPEP